MTTPAWPPRKKDIYSYSMPENLGTHAVRSLPFFRRKNRWRALLLVLPAIFELPYLLLLMFRRGTPRRYAFVNKMAVDLLDTTAGSQTIVLGSLLELPLAQRKGALWIPVSALYIALAWSKWTTQGELPFASRLLIGALHRALASRLAGNGWLIMHSDALPLGRALVAIARHLGVRTCCVQHGIFHEQLPLPEIDGSQCDLNVVRSEVDARIIQRANSATMILVEPDLFRPPRPRTVPTILRVSLIGEAWHTCDQSFDRVHRSRLREFEAGLVRAHIDVSFRPHPSERYRAWLYGFQRLDFGSKRRAFERFNVFVGYASTLLHEADAVGHLAVQVVFPGRMTPVIFRDGDRDIARVQTADELLALLSQGRREPADAPQAIQDDRIVAVARVIAELQGKDRSLVCP